MLDKVRVLEVSHAVAGPTAAQVLADYGAEVLKIEKPGEGDIFRNVPGMGPTMFLAVNRGKKSLAIDLKKSEGLTIFYELVRKTDVVIENLGPGVAEKLGISFEKIRKNNSRAIYCKIESFGKGPNREYPGFRSDPSSLSGDNVHDRIPARSLCAGGRLHGGHEHRAPRGCRDSRFVAKASGIGPGSRAAGQFV